MEKQLDQQRSQINQPSKREYSFLKQLDQCSLNYNNYQQSPENSSFQEEGKLQTQLSKINTTIKSIQLLISSYKFRTQHQDKQELFKNPSVEQNSLKVTKNITTICQNQNSKTQWPWASESTQQHCYKQLKANSLTCSMIINDKNRKSIALNKDHQPNLNQEKSKGTQIKQLNLKDERAFNKNQRKSQHIENISQESHLKKMEQDILKLKKRYQYANNIVQKQSNKFYLSPPQAKYQPKCERQQNQQILTFQVSESDQSCLLDENIQSLTENNTPSFSQKWRKKQSYYQFNTLYTNNSNNDKKKLIPPLPKTCKNKTTKNVDITINPQEDNRSDTKKRQIFKSNYLPQKQYKGKPIHGYNYKPIFEAHSSPLSQKINKFKQFQRKDIEKNKIVSPTNFIQHNKQMINLYQRKSKQKQNQINSKRYSSYSSDHSSKEKNKNSQKQSNVRIQANLFSKKYKNATLSTPKQLKKLAQTPKATFYRSKRWQEPQEEDIETYFDKYYRKVKDYCIVKNELSKQQLQRIFKHRVLSQNIEEAKWSMITIGYARMKQRGCILIF